MPTNYSFQFYVADPGVPPAVGTLLNPVTLTATDSNDDGFIRITGGDTIGGFVVTNVWVGDTMTMRSGGVTYTITGVTFYRSGAAAVFMPTDGTVLVSARFRSSTFVSTSTEYQVGPVPCFVAGTQIATPDGPRAVEDLVPGDLVQTRDHGAQPLAWVGSRRVPGVGDNAPVRLMPGALGNTRALEVSPNHRLLITGWRAELHFGEDEVLVAARHLVNGDTIHRAPCADVTYVHLMFARHEVIFAEGAAAESLHPGDYLLRDDSRFRQEILRVFPDLAQEPGRAGWITARRVASGREAAVLMAA